MVRHERTVSNTRQLTVVPYLVAALSFSLILVACNERPASNDKLEGIFDTVTTKSVDGKRSLSLASLETLKTLCRKDAHEGCHRLAQFVGDINPLSAELLYRYSCDAGYARACESYVAGRVALTNAEAVFADPELQKLIQKSCNVEEPVLNTKGCERYAELLIAQGQGEQARPLLQELAMVSGEGHGKLALAKLAQDAGEGELGCALRHAACNQQAVGACTAAAQCENSLPARVEAIGENPSIDPSSNYNALAEHAFKSGDFDLAKRYYDLICRFGYLGIRNHRGEPWACHRSKILTELKQELTKLPHLEERCFKSSDRDACDDLADLYSRAGKDADAAAISAKECTSETNVLDFQGHTACLRHIENLKKANKLEEAHKLTSTFCARGEAVMCMELAELEMSAGNDGRAFELAEEQCFKFTPRSCPLRDKLLAKRGIATAKSYYETHCQKEDALSCFSLGMILMLQSDASSAESMLQKAEELFDAACKKEADNGKNRRRGEEICGAHAAIACLRGNQARGSSELEALCKNGSDKACKILKEGRCARAKEEMLGDVKRRFNL